jgi:hypothetical protein
MKIKSFTTMTMVTVALVFGMSSCGDDDKDEPEAALAEQVDGWYTGQEILTVMGEPDEGTVMFLFTKSSDIAVDMTIPAYGEGMMTIPELPVKGITLTKSGNTITGKLASYTGSVASADGSEKAYTVSDVTVLFNDKNVVVTFSLKYGNMPFAFDGQFTGRYITPI